MAFEQDISEKFKIDGSTETSWSTEQVFQNFQSTFGRLSQSLEKLPPTALHYPTRFDEAVSRIHSERDVKNWFRDGVTHLIPLQVRDDHWIRQIRDLVVRRLEHGELRRRQPVLEQDHLGHDLVQRQ